MGLFGWSLPPGVSTLPGEGDDSCQMCGRNPDDCECPVCPTCEEVGRPECYTEHGMVKTPIQLEAEKRWEEDNRAQAEAEAKMFESMKDEEQY